jgi:hypothetical protein
MMCCAAECGTCGAKGAADEKCSKDVIVATKLCADGGAIPCMIKLIPTAASRASFEDYKQEQIRLDEEAMHPAVDTPVAATGKAWWQFWK